MSNKRKLHTREFTPFPSVSLTGTQDPREGETCTFHPDCCDPEDTQCAGCGQPAILAVIHRVNGADRRTPFCEDHSDAVGLITDALVQREYGHAN